MNTKSHEALQELTALTEQVGGYDEDFRSYPLSAYTVWCQQANGAGTIWIGDVGARDAEHAQEVGREACRADWGWADETDIHVLGVAEGRVKILFWEDVDDV